VFVALVFQHEMRMRRIILPSVACYLLYRILSILSQKEHDLKENKCEHKYVFFDSAYKLFKTCLIAGTIERDIVLPGADKSLARPGRKQTALVRRSDGQRNEFVLARVGTGGGLL